MKLQTHSGEFEISDTLVQAWSIRYPTADFRREYPLMVLWITKNQARRPKNAIRFVENWLKRVQEQETRNLQEHTKRGAASAERIGERYGVKPYPGELQEHFNRRVIDACSRNTVKRIPERNH